MVALRSRCGHYILQLWFLTSFFFFFSSPILSGRRLAVYHRSTEVDPTLHDVCPYPGLVHYIEFVLLGEGFLHCNGTLPGAKFTCVQVLCSPILAALLHGHCSGGRQPDFAAWYKEWNYGAFAPRHFQRRAPPIFRVPTAAIMLGIGLHSSYGCPME